MDIKNHSQNKDLKLADWIRNNQFSVLQEMLSVAARPEIISFALGLPDKNLFPVEALREAAAKVLTENEQALQYQPPSGNLKSQVVALMKQRGVVCSEDQVFLTAGAQQGMSLLTRLLLNQKGQVLIEELSYTGFQQVIMPFEPQILTVGTDLETGMDIDAVEAHLKNGNRPAFIYAVTVGHNPLGINLSNEKRRRLVELARHYAVPIIEDDAYGFLSYENTPSLPMRALDDEWVFYVGSFSKILSPSLRVGWLVVPSSLTVQLSSIKESSDINTATFSQHLVSAFLENQSIDYHLALLQSRYKTKRDAMLAALEKYFPPTVSWVKPQNGMFIWVSLPESADATVFLRKALTDAQVAFVPGQSFCIRQTEAANCFRLNFSNSSLEDIELGMERLGNLFDIMFNISS